MYYREHFENGYWWCQTTPLGEWKILTEKRFYAIHVDTWDNEEEDIKSLSDADFRINSTNQFRSNDELCEFLNENESNMMFWRFC